jgi:hypothetical protein
MPGESASIDRHDSSRDSLARRLDDARRSGLLLAACGEAYRKHLMPPLGEGGGRHSSISRPAPHGALEVMHRAPRMARGRRRWQAAHPLEAGSI